MTLHIYGAIDGAVVVMSDGRTTYEHRAPDNNVQKFVTYSLTASAGGGTESDSFQPGDFAAVLMVQNRASFNPIGRPQDEHRATAAEVVVKSLQDPALQCSDVSELGDAVWKAIENRWLESCGMCADLADRRRRGTDGGEVCEHEDYDDGGFTLLIAAINDPRYQGPVHYVRERLDFRLDVATLGNLEIHFSGPIGENPIRMSGDVTTNDDKRILAEMAAAFRLQARNPSATPEWAEWAQTVGGTIRTVVLDPRTGFRLLESFDLDGH
ncbi:hypothetical protein ACHMZP_34195 [Rhodococcus baikonurensis]|uniref:hypothetical protein n=1 Tax=Rhodococcus baikonurensis TaxID=172041 RepID=UPI0037ACDDEE